MRSRDSNGSTAMTRSSSPAWTSMARRCSRRRRAKGSRRSNSPTARRRNLPPWALALEAPADDIVRTTQPRHHEAAQEIWRRMAAKGDIYLSKYPGWYSVRDEAFFDESELTLTAEGKHLAPSGAPVEWVEEESYYFKLSAYQDKLLAHYRGASRLHRAGELSQRRSSPSSRAVSTICRSAARPSIGASRCRAIRNM